MNPEQSWMSIGFESEHWLSELPDVYNFNWLECYEDCAVSSYFVLFCFVLVIAYSFNDLLIVVNVNDSSHYHWHNSNYNPREKETGTPARIVHWDFQLINNSFILINI